VVHEECLAARPPGLGTSLTTLHRGHQDELRELIGLPGDALTMALIPIGWPTRGRWAQPRRRPVEEIVHRDRWDATRTRDTDAAGARRLGRSGGRARSVVRSGANGRILPGAADGSPRPTHR